MDITIPPKVIRRRQLQRLGRYLLAGAGAILLVMVLGNVISPSLDLDELRSAIVEYGPVSTEVEAAGTVVPINERVLASPLTSSIAEVYVSVGNHVEAGDPLLKIDGREIEQEIGRLRDELRLKELQIQGTLQAQEQSLRELRNRQELLEVDLLYKQATLERYTALREGRIVTKALYDEARLDVERTEIQIRQIERQIADVTASDANQRAQHEVERQLLMQNLKKQERLLAQATVRADSAGVVTTLVNQLGRNVTAGTELARISDLSAFRVDATLSDYHLHQVAKGMPVRIDFGATPIEGRVERILPAVDNGTLRLQIALADPSNSQLKQNLRVQARIVTAERSSGLRVANGIVFNGTGVHDVFVLHDGKAARRSVEAGLSNSRYVEILHGLEEGEEVIISDMSDYEHLREIAVRD